jgi:ribonuclease J
VPHGRLYKDGFLIETDQARAVVERRRMSFAGAVFVALAITEKGELADDPQVDMLGVPEKDADGKTIDDRVYDVIMSTFESLPRARRRDPDALAESIRRAVRSEVNNAWGKKPVCQVQVLTV